MIKQKRDHLTISAINEKSFIGKHYGIMQKKSARFFILFLNYTELSTAQNRINGIKLNMGPLLTVTVDIL